MSYRNPFVCPKCNSGYAESMRGKKCPKRVNGKACGGTIVPTNYVGGLDRFTFNQP